MFGRRDRMVLVSPDDQVHLRKSLRERRIVGERQMRDRDDHVDTSRSSTGKYVPAASSGSVRRTCVSLSRLVSVVFRHGPMNPTFNASNVLTR
jgi:hypothetical protein